MHASNNPREIDEAELVLTQLADKGSPAALLRKGKELYNAQRVREAKTIFEALERANPSRDVFLYLGKISARDCKVASAYFLKAIEKDSSCAECYFHRGVCLSTLGMDGSANEQFRKVVELTNGRTEREFALYNQLARQRIGEVRR